MNGRLPGNIAFVGRKSGFTHFKDFVEAQIQLQARKNNVVKLSPNNIDCESKWIQLEIRNLITHTKKLRDELLEVISEIKKEGIKNA